MLVECECLSLKNCGMIYFFYLRIFFFQVSTFQMCILMLFNNRDKWTYDVSKLYLAI